MILEHSVSYIFCRTQIKVLVHLNLFHNDKMGNTDGIERVLQICTSYFIDASHKHVVPGSLRSCRPWYLSFFVSP
jgi:hypothetical protein